MDIDVNDLNHYFFSQIIDIREKDRYDKYHIPGSINVPFNYLIIHPEKYLDKNKEYLIICEYGLKSKKVCEILKKAKYLTKNLSGGIKEYQRFYKTCQKK